MVNEMKKQSTRSAVKGNRRHHWALAAVAFLVCAAAVAPLEAESFLQFPEKPAQDLSDQQNHPVAGPPGNVESVADARRAVEENPASSKAYLSLGIALVKIGDDDGALQAFESAVHFDSSEEQAWYLKGLIEARRTMWAAAAQDFRQAVESRESFVDARIELGDMLRRTGDFDGAAAELSRAVKMNSRIPLGHYNLGLVEMQEGKFKTAEQEFRKALALQKDFPEAQQSLGQSMLLEHDWAGAAAVFEPAVAAQPDSLELANEYAVALSHLEDRKPAAAAAFAKAQELARRNLRLQRAETENTEGLHFWQAGDAASALAAFKQAVKDAPEYAEAHYNLGRFQLEHQNLSGAVEQYKAAIGCRKRFPEALNNLGEAYLRLGESERAIQSFQAALDIRPGFVAAHFNLGMALNEQGMRKEAEKQFRQTLVLAPQTAAAHIELGLLFSKNDGALSSRARKELREGLRLDPKLSRLIPEDIRAQLE